jgi:hypothetical protein
MKWFIKYLQKSIFIALSNVILLAGEYGWKTCMQTTIMQRHLTSDFIKIWVTIYDRLQESFDLRTHVKPVP